MAGMLPTNRRTLTLIETCQDKNAFTPAYFWPLVQRKGMILVIVRNTLGFVFGGFVEDIFKSDDYYYQRQTGSSSNFAFSFGCPGSSPVKLIKDSSRTERCIEMDSSYAFAMGTSSYGFDLRVECGRYQFAPSTFKTIAPGYPNVTVDDKLLAGSRTWEPEFIEVWQCS